VPRRFDDDEEQLHASLDARILRRLLAYALPHRKALGVAWLLTALDAQLALLGPFLIKIAVDKYIVGANLRGLGGISAVYVAVSACLWAIACARIRMVAATGENMIYDLRIALFSHLQRLSMSYYDKTKVGWIVARGTSDVGVIRETLTWSLSEIIYVVCRLLGAMFWMAKLSPPLFAATFVVIPLLFAVTMVFRPMAVEAYRATRQTISRVTSHFAENVSGIRVVQSFGREEHNIGEFSRLNVDNLVAHVGAARIACLYRPTMRVVVALGTAVVLGYGTHLLIGGRITVGVLIGFLGYIGMFFWPIMMSGQLYNQTLAAMAAGERLFQLLDTEPDVRDAPGAVDIPLIEGYVTFEDVCFSYEEGTPVLEEIALEVEAGSTIALVGATGSGKSTMVSLLARFYDVTSGRILIDGYDLREVTLRSLHEQMGIVVQENFLFDGTVMDNIKYVRPGSTDEQAVAAARAIGLHDLIEAMPDGYETDVGERGEKLSAGQRQGVCFVRAMLANPRILILDEATASIDTVTEMLIQDAIQRLLVGRTSFVVAHRLSTVRSADLILVLDGGRIVERGTHEELLHRRGLYSRMYEEFVADTRG